MKDTELYVLVVSLSGRDNKKLSKLVGKWLERSAYWSEYKTKCENENTKILCTYFLATIVLGVIRLYVL